MDWRGFSVELPFDPAEEAQSALLLSNAQWQGAGGLGQATSANASKAWQTRNECRAAGRLDIGDIHQKQDRLSKAV